MFPISTLPNPVNRVSSMPSLLSLSDDSAANNDYSEDLLKRKLQALISFIRSLKKQENKQNLDAMIQSFPLDAFVDRKSSIPDLKLEAALKKIRDLKQEQNELKIVLLDHAHQTGSLKRKVADLEDVVAQNEQEMNEISQVAKEQQELIESMHKQSEQVRCQFAKYRELVEKKQRIPPPLSSKALEILECRLHFENMPDTAYREIGHLVSFLKALSGK